MPIEFLDLLDDGGWEPLVPNARNPGSTWSDGGLLADAPVDLAATFDGAAWRATGIDPSFGLNGVRLRGGFTVPRHHHSSALLLLVFDGALTVAADDGAEVLGPGEYCVIEEGTAHRLTAGAEGATYLWSWPQEAAAIATCWYPDPAWARTEAPAR
ncbi:MAG TPA: cupin domain-containing protein [Microthrixaceae bacterium]|nr:cupin domain-containing protein [Microthrixaceae bacterium]